MKHCPSCARQFADQVQFCPFDGVAIEAIKESPPSAPSVPSASRNALIGRTLAGKYRLEARLREESSIMVYGATNLELSKPVLLKLFRTDLAGLATTHEMLGHARAVAGMEHPGIVPILDIGLDDENNLAYAAVEIVDGISLRERLVEHGPFDEPQVRGILKQVCSAFQTVNSSGFIARGLGATDVWLIQDKSYVPIVMIDCSWHGLPATKDVLDKGSDRLSVARALYISPEECRGEEPDAHSDVYRLGLLAYEMLAGKPPFVSASLPGLISLHLDEAPLPIEIAAPDARAAYDIERVIMRALAKLPRFRHQSAEDFARDLEEGVDHSRRTSVIQNPTFPAAVPEQPLVLPTDGLPVMDVLTVTGPPDALTVEARPLKDLSTKVSQPRVDITEIQRQIVAQSDEEFFLLESRERQTAERPLPAPTQSAQPPATENVNEIVFTLEDQPRLPDQRRLPDQPQAQDQPPIEEQPKPKQKPLFLNEKAQFTVWQPACVQPLTWVPLLAVAQIADDTGSALGSFEGANAGAPDIQSTSTGENAHTDSQSRVEFIDTDGRVTFVPSVHGMEFNPPSITFQWTEKIHREGFQMRASAQLDRQTARGRLSVFIGGILLAEVPLSVHVDGRYEAPSVEADAQTVSAKPYRKVFTSFANEDSRVVEEVGRFAENASDPYGRELLKVRAGESWSAKIEKLILEADVFQLFWSSKSMLSPFVRREWEYALSLRRPNFVRPTYWEHPIPASIHDHLPPEELTRLRFQKIWEEQGDQESSATASEPGTGPLASGSLSTVRVTGSVPKADSTTQTTVPATSPATPVTESIKSPITRIEPVQQHAPTKGPQLVAPATQQSAATKPVNPLETRSGSPIMGNGAAVAPAFAPTPSPAPQVHQQPEPPAPSPTRSTGESPAHSHSPQRAKSSSPKIVLLLILFVIVGGLLILGMVYFMTRFGR